MDYELIARPHWSSTEPTLKQYDVMVGGKKVGTVEGYYPTIEKKIPGKRYVAWRRKSVTLHWVPEYEGARRRYRSPCRTRKEAIQEVLEAHDRRLGDTPC